MEHARSRSRSTGHSMLSTVFPLTSIATGRSSGAPATKGRMAISARPARDGMLRTVMPLKWYRSSMRFAGAFSGKSMRCLMRPSGTRTGWLPALTWT
jgi:hypothetical protein